MKTRFALLCCFATMFCMCPRAEGQQTNDSTFYASIARYRAQYKNDFLNDDNSPLGKSDTAFLDFYKPDPAWRVQARFERAQAAEPFDMPTYSGKTARYIVYGTLYFEAAGQPCSLRVYRNLRLAGMKEYADYLFVPFKDLTSGGDTYGGGRYIDMRTGQISADNQAVLDFNKAYNPYCAYSDGYSCPVPPLENRLNIAVSAGERNFKKDKKH